MANNRRAWPMSSIDTSNNRNEARHGPWKRAWPSPVEQRADWGLRSPFCVLHPRGTRFDYETISASLSILLPPNSISPPLFFPPSRWIFSPISRARYPFELKFSLIASRFTFGCLTFIFDPVPFSSSLLPKRNPATLRRPLFFLRRVFYLLRDSN